MIKRLKSLPKSVTAMLVTALVLLVFSTVGGARAALKYFSQTYTGQFQTYHIGTRLNENGNLSASKKWSSGSWTTAWKTGKILPPPVPDMTLSPS